MGVKKGCEGTEGDCDRWVRDVCATVAHELDEAQRSALPQGEPFRCSMLPREGEGCATQD